MKVMEGKKISTKTVLAIGGAAVAAYFLLKKAPSPPLPGKANLFGKVTSSGSALADALITVRSITRSVSDASGNYTVTDLEPGTADIRCDRPGYVTVSASVNLIEGENNRYDFVLVSETQPALHLSNLQIYQVKPWVGFPVSISAIGTTEVSSTYTVSLKVNGVVVQTKNLTVSVGEQKTIEFSYTPTIPGTYAVELDGLSSQFVVETLPAVLYVENLQINPTYPLVGSQVQISVIGTTDISGSYLLDLKVNGAVTQTKQVVITAGEAKLITFTYSPANTGIYSVQVGSLSGQFEAVEGLLCYNDGLLFATQADLNAHINTVHPSLPTAPLIIKNISWGSNSMDLSSGRLVGLQNNMWIYLLDNRQAPQPYGPVAITFKTGNLWHYFAPSDFPEIEVRANVFVGKFGDIGSNPFNAFVGSSGAPILYLTAGGTLPGRTGDSGKTFTMITSAGLGPLQPGLYDIMVFVTMTGAGQGIFAYMPMSSYNYVILDAWRAL